MEIVNQSIEDYICSQIAPEPPILKELNRDTNAHILMPRMLSGHLQGRVLSMLSNMVKPKRILEIGTFTGYSALCLAEGLDADGLLYTIDINEELEQMAKKYFTKAKLSHQIKQFIGDAQEIIPQLNEMFDIVFIDADKRNYCKYYDLVFDKVNVGGYIIADNILWSGKVLSPNPKDKDLNEILTYNTKVKDDARVTPLILPLRDGLSIAKKIAC